MFRTLVLITSLLCVVSCSTENPLCTQNFCVEGEIFPRSELGDRVSNPMPANINEDALLHLLTPGKEVWQELITLHRHPLHWEKFHIATHADNDKILRTFAKGNDLLFVIKSQQLIRHAQFYLHQPIPPREHPAYHTLHYRSQSGIWFDKVNPADEETCGLRISLDITQSPNPGEQYLFWAEFGMSADGWIVGGPGHTFIHEGTQLVIYYR